VADNEQPAARGGAMKLVIIGVLALVLIGGGGVAAYLFLFKGDAAPAAQAETPKAPERKEALYMELKPPFVVNFEDQHRVRFMQVTVALMSREQAVLDAVDRHMPLIRNDLVMLLSSRPYEAINTREGKEALRAQAEQEVNQVLEQETGRGGVEALYFTSFVVQ
jgi:flagellar FliL protein